MKAVFFCIVFSLFCLVQAGIYPQQHSFPVCKASPTKYCARPGCTVWYVSPVSGNDTTGLGTQKKPWNDVSYVISNYLNCSWSNHGGKLTPRNSNGVVQAGDVIVLMDGISTINIQRQVNSLPVTITVDPSVHTTNAPIVNTIYMLSATNFTFACLNVTYIGPGKHGVVTMDSVNYYGNCTSNKFFNNSIYAFQDLPDDNKTLADSLGGSGVYEHGAYNNFTGNYIYNVRDGISASGKFAYIGYNHVNYFMGDGFDILNNYTTVEFNLVTNSMDTDGGAQHRDGCQMFDDGDVNSLQNVTIRNNKFIASVDPNRPYAAWFQGVTGFDVLLNNTVVANNLIVTNYEQGIALYSSYNGIVVGNTLFNPVEHGDNIWISFDHKGGNPSSLNNTVVNNICNSMSSWGAPRVTLATGNVITSKYTFEQLTSWFVTNVTGREYDLVNVAGNPFIGAGNSSTPVNNWAMYDITEKVRAVPYDVGCWNLKYAKN